MTLINSGGTTLTGATTTISSIPGTYKNLFLIVQDFLPASDDQGLRIRFNSDSNNRYGYSASVNFTTTFGENAFNIAPGNDNSVANGLAAAWIYDYANTSSKKLWSAQTSYYANGNVNFSSYLTGGWLATPAA